MLVQNVVSRLWRNFRCWCQSRNWRTLLLGLPAVAVGTAVVVLGLMSLNFSIHEAQARYAQEGKAALARGDYPRALCCYERLAPTATEEPEVLYRLALAAEQVGQLDRTIGLMNELAPASSNGYGPAHFWWARKWLLVDKPTQRTQASAEIHLVRALDGELEDREEAHGLLGQLYMGRGRLEDAEIHLLKAVKFKPHLRLWLARLYAQRKEMDRARREADLAVRYYRGRAKHDLENVTARLSWADAVAALEDYSGAVAILEEGLSATRSQIYRVALGRLYKAWYDSSKLDNGVDKGTQFDLLEKGLLHDPSNKDLLDRTLATLRKPGREADRARKLLHQLLASGKAMAYAHFALSVDALQRGNAKESQLHLERAHEIDPKMTVVANNLAWSLAEAAKPDLPRALGLINLALQQEPNNRVCKDTRGRIYLKMGRWRESLSDLEAVLRHSPDNPGLHQCLAEVYDKLGNASLAAEHRQRARAVAAGGKPPRP